MSLCSVMLTFSILIVVMLSVIILNVDMISVWRRMKLGFPPLPAFLNGRTDAKHELPDLPSLSLSLPPSSLYPSLSHSHFPLSTHTHTHARTRLCVLVTTHPPHDDEGGTREVNKINETVKLTCWKSNKTFYLRHRRCI